MKQEIIRMDLNGVNCYLGKSEEGFVLFDTGGHLTMDKEYTDRKEILIDKLEKEGCIPGKLKAIILTHGDNDHIANAAYLREKYHTIVAMHADDVELAENIDINKMMESFQFKSLPLKIAVLVIRKKIIKVSAKILRDFVKFRPDVILGDGFDLSVYGFAAKIFHTPGHTAGSIVALSDSGELIAGDTFANINKPTLAANAYDFKQLHKSMKKLMLMNITTVYPGHGEPFLAKELS